MIVLQVHRRIAVGWMAESGGRFEVGQVGDGSEASAEEMAVAYAGTLQDAGHEVKVIRTQTSTVWPQSEHRTREVSLEANRVEGS